MLAPGILGKPIEAHRRINPLAGEPDGGKRGTWTRPRPPVDPLAQRSQSSVGPVSRTFGIIRRFSGMRDSGAIPPDTTGDVGPNHYIQMVNGGGTYVSIYNKTGTLLVRFILSTLWASGPCTGDGGDPVVVYDEMADRWLLAQFPPADSPNLCFAVSQTNDPTGAFYLYTFNTGSFPDYFKIGAWPNGYYVSANEGSYTAYAFDRVKMLAGDAGASFVKFTGKSNFLLPADVDGPMTPDGGGLFFTFKDDSFHGGRDRIELYELTPDFATPANSTFTRIRAFATASFTYTACGFFNLACISQKNTAQKIDALSEWPMQRLVYRRFQTHEALVGNFTVGGGLGEAGAAIRWFELRRTGGNWKLFQEGTHDPGDGHDRFMGSIAIDKYGNIALGYSVSSSTMFPSVAYVTRTERDARGTMGSERILMPGKGSQTGYNRWGDYSAMTVDPTTGCQFWYTNEYYNQTSAGSWKTVVGTFSPRKCR